MFVASWRWFCGRAARCPGQGRQAVASGNGQDPSIVDRARPKCAAMRCGPQRRLKRSARIRSSVRALVRFGLRPGREDISAMPCSPRALYRSTHFFRCGWRALEPLRSAAPSPALLDNQPGKFSPGLLVSGRHWHGKRRTREPPGVEMSVVTQIDTGGSRPSHHATLFITCVGTTPWARSPPGHSAPSGG